MKLNIYKDKLLREVREVREVPRMKIPYRTAETVADLLAEIDLENVDETKVLRLVLKNKNLLTEVVQATFALPDEDLAFIDILELSDLARDIIRFVIEKMAELGADAEEADPNGQTPATTA